MKVEDTLLESAIKLLQHKPYNEITFADIADESGKHWTTVKRYFGSKENMRSLLYQKQLEKEDVILDTRTKILDSGSQLFAKDGYEGTSLDQIAAEAGLSKGAVYWHFSNKSELYLAICDRSLKRLMTNIDEKFTAVFTSEDKFEAIKELIISELKTCEKYRGELPRLFLQFVSTTKEEAIQKKLSESFTALFSQTTNVLRRFQQAKIISQKLDCEQLAVSLHATINGLVLMWLVNPAGVSFERISSTVAEMLLHGIDIDENE